MNENWINEMINLLVQMNVNFLEKLKRALKSI